jgi:hypothetical protein
LALDTAKHAECARRQGKLWELHDTLFANTTRLDPANIRLLSGSIGLDLPMLSECLSDADTTKKISMEIEEARSLGMKPSIGVLITAV